MKPIFIIAGIKGSGKTTFLVEILMQLQMNGVKVGGFVSVHEQPSDCYQILDVQTNEEYPLMQRIGTYEQRPHQFKFFPDGVALGNRCFNHLLSHPPAIAVVDEIGGFELAGDLWSSSFTQLVKSSTPLLFTTKAKHLEKVIKNWDIKPTIVFQVDDFDNPIKAANQLMKFLTDRHLQ